MRKAMSSVRRTKSLREPAQPSAAASTTLYSSDNRSSDANAARIATAKDRAITTKNKMAAERPQRPVNDLFLGELVQNSQFRKQRQLHRRKSVSLESVPLTGKQERFAGEKKAKAKEAGLSKVKAKSNVELLHQFESVNAADERRPSPLPFPTDTDDDVELRRRTSSSGCRSKTICVLHSKDDRFVQEYAAAEKAVEIRGVTKITFPKGAVRKIPKGCVVRFADSNMVLVSEKGACSQVLGTGVKIAHESRPNKKEMEFQDEHGASYRFHFDHARDARQRYFDCPAEGANQQQHDHNEHNERSNSFGEKQKTIGNMLLGFLRRRSSRDLLERKGILENEPIFGNTLVGLQKKHRVDVPQFVTKVAELIERPENITSLGLYRASGNLATVQKIRYEANRNNLRALDDHASDVDVLAGALKLFFRELMEPLIPYRQYQELLAVLGSKNNGASSDTLDIDDMFRSMHTAHKETLRFLLDHLLKVEEHKDENQMNFYNLSVVWGPSLTWLPEQQCYHPTVANESINNNNNIVQQQNIIANSTKPAKVLEFVLEAYAQKQREQQIPTCDSGCFQKRAAADRGGATVADRHPRRLPSPPSPVLCFHSSPPFGLSEPWVPRFLRIAARVIEENATRNGLYATSGDCAICREIEDVVVCRRRFGRLLSEHAAHGLEMAWVVRSFFGSLRKPLYPFVVEDSAEELASRSWRQEKPRKRALTILFDHLAALTERGQSAAAMAEAWSTVLYEKPPEHAVRLIKTVIEAHGAISRLR